MRGAGAAGNISGCGHRKSLFTFCVPYALYERRRGAKFCSDTIVHRTLIFHLDLSVNASVYGSAIAD
jgi:hypothetical protein